MRASQARRFNRTRKDMAKRMRSALRLDPAIAALVDRFYFRTTLRGMFTIAIGDTEGHARHADIQDMHKFMCAEEKGNMGDWGLMFVGEAQDGDILLRIEMIPWYTDDLNDDCFPPLGLIVDIYIINTSTNKLIYWSGNKRVSFANALVQMSKQTLDVDIDGKVFPIPMTGEKIFGLRALAYDSAWGYDDEHQRWVW